LEPTTEAYWDHFSAEYIEIQEEEQPLMAQKLADFLQTAGILPQESLLDLAGGAGRYLPYLEPLVTRYTLADISSQMVQYAKSKTRNPQSQFWHVSQAELFRKMPDNQFSVVFSAMNPSIQSAQDLLQLHRLSAEWVVIFRMRQVSDEIFTPVEKKLGQWQTDHWLERYQQLLKGLKINYQVKKLVVTHDERVTPQFFADYFAMDLEEPTLKKLVEKFFPTGQPRQNKEKIVFEVLYWKKEKSEA
jgi:hypothetical protein